MHPQTVVDSILEYVDKVLCIDNYLNSKCIEDACRLKHVVLALVKNCQLHPLLIIFGHSVSCTSLDCTTSCRMFKRIRNHIHKSVAVKSFVTEQHICAVMQVYGQLLRMHVDTCLSDVCGMHSCKDMKKMREKKGHKVLPETFAQKELALKDSIAVMPVELGDS